MGCVGLRRYAQDSEKARSYREKYAPGCPRRAEGVQEERPGSGVPTAHRLVSYLDAVGADTVTNIRRDAKLCYHPAAEAWPELEGRVVLELLIRPDGTVGEVAVPENDTGIRAVACCLASAARTWSFAARASGAPVIVQLTFRLTRDAWFVHEGSE
ncbi:MAG TPA: AgmX/PglI C-terminal domain-containing protein [Polyangiales bacterium]|nr:AgmX/PglI C-terminal domain-containing protein [Polyangiales bacterium]